MGTKFEAWNFKQKNKIIMQISIFFPQICPKIHWAKLYTLRPGS